MCYKSTSYNARYEKSMNPKSTFRLLIIRTVGCVLKCPVYRGWLQFTAAKVSSPDRSGSSAF